jgi:predicted enzyme related to lactoylglutathione lyase
MEKLKSAINWFEIPAKNFERAKSFYEKVLDAKLKTMSKEDMGMTMAFFPADLENGVGGGIAFGPGYEPSDKGALIYLNGGDDLSTPLSRVEGAGGKIVVPKTSLGPNGFMAQFIDSEENKVAFHSRG